MSSGMKISPRMVMIPSQKAMTANVSWANCFAAPAPSVCNSPEKAGMNAALNAPSPNRRRNRFGSFNATKNASAIGPVPISAAISMSRAKP